MEKDKMPGDEAILSQDADLAAVEIERDGLGWKVRSPLQIDEEQSSVRVEGDDVADIKFSLSKLGIEDGAHLYSIIPSREIPKGRQVKFGLALFEAVTAAQAFDPAAQVPTLFANLVRAGWSKDGVMLDFGTMPYGLNSALFAGKIRPFSRIMISTDTAKQMIRLLQQAVEGTK